MKIVILMTVHNRREETISCLERIYAQTLPDCCTLSVVLVDDGSTDGTSVAVKDGFPRVQIIAGDGNLYWNQGMRKAWDFAAQDDYDVYIWLNDDTLLLPQALTTLLSVLQEGRRDYGEALIVVGTCRQPGSANAANAAGRVNLDGALTYGGRNESGLVFPGENTIHVSSFNGNLVAVSRGAFQVLGNLSAAYRHGFGDIDYGVRAKQASVPILLAPGFLAECALNPPLKYRDPRVGLLDRLRACRGPKGLSFRELKHFHRLRGHGAWPLSVLKQYLIVIFPSLVPASPDPNRGQRPPTAKEQTAALLTPPP